MQSRSGNLEQIKNLLNKQINQTHQMQFQCQPIEIGNKSMKYNKPNSILTNNFTEIQEAVTPTPKQKFIQINETPHHAEFKIVGFGDKNNNNNNSILNNNSMINNKSMMNLKQPYYGHQKSKSTTSMIRHVSIMCTNEDASCSSKATNNNGQIGNGTNKNNQVKKQNGGQPMSQISIFSHDVSNAGDNMTTFYSSNVGRPETSHSNAKRNISINKYQANNNDDDNEDKITQNQSPNSHHRILSASISSNFPLTGAAFISAHSRNVSNTKDPVRPFSQNNNNSTAKNKSASQPRPQTAIQSNFKEKEVNEENKNQQTHAKPSHQQFFLQRVYSSSKKRKVQNQVGNTSSIFELYDDKKIEQASVQKKKALDTFLMLRNSTNTLRHHLLKQQQNNNKSLQNNKQLQSDNASLIYSNQNSSTNLIELIKTRKRIIQELISEMQNEQKDFVSQIIEAESKNIVFTSQFVKMEKLIDTNDLQLLLLQLLFLAKSCLAISDYDKATYFLQQAKVMTDMSKKMAPFKSQVYLILGEVAIRIGKYREAVKIFKKVFQYSWFFNQRESEIDAYEKLGLSYFYLQDIKMSDFYHSRSSKALYEIKNSHIRNISYENINEYFTKCEYNLNSITPILMVHLSLPVQYSLDKVQQGLRESFLKQEQKQNKRNSNINQKLENLAKESQKEVENFVQSRQKIFLQSSAVKIIDQIMEDKEFIFESDTPKQFEDVDDTNQQQQKISSSEISSNINNPMTQSSISFAPNGQVQKKRVWEAPVLRKITYDISKFGPVEDPRPSQRVFEDITKYKLSLDKKIEILQKQKIDLNKIMQKVNYLVSNNIKYNAKMNQRVRISHLTPNRQDIFKYDTPFFMISSINKAYNKFINQLRKAEQAC